MAERKFKPPTGYEKEQRKIELKRKLSQALLERALTPQEGMRSPLQAIGQVMSAFAGKRLEKKAGKLEDKMFDRYRTEYANKAADFNADVNSGMGAQALQEKWGSDAMMEDMLKPHTEAYASGLKNREDLFDTGGALGFQRKGDFFGKPAPFDPNKAVYTDPITLEAKVNPVKATAGLAAQGLVSPRPGDQAGYITPQYSMGQPGAAPAQGGAQNFTPEQQAMVPDILRQAAGNPNIPSGSPLDPNLASPPTKSIGGKQYFFVNGEWYDNPEGQ